jgi:hypothetical protein
VSAAPTRVAFNLIGGSHQFLHIVPVAVELAKMPGFEVQAYVSEAGDATLLAEMVEALGGPPLTIKVMTLPHWLSWVGSLKPRWKSLKLPRLLYWGREMCRADAVVTAERTSTILKKIPGLNPILIHIPHGAGDRAKGFEKRFSIFDYVIVAGSKDRDRLIAQGLLKPDQCATSGYIKLAALARINADKPKRLFDNDRPTILYNAHFDPVLSSWTGSAQAVIDWVKASERYNLIVAPHIRLFEGATEEQRAKWTSQAKEGQIIIDLGSERSIDATYVRAADIYLGDVSSQVYEFIAEPRPCVFINSHSAAWRDNPDYRMWQFGEVIASGLELAAVIDRASACHQQFDAIQEELGEAAMGDASAYAPQKAAELIADFVNR